MTPQRVKEIEDIFNGKTIESLDAGTVNQWLIKFTDGTEYAIDIIEKENTEHKQGSELALDEYL